jgi:biofilm PGA synthesis protein PgaA
MIKQRLRVPFFSALLISNATVLNVSSVFAQTAQAQYDTIIANARAGAHGLAIETLRAWRAQHPDDRKAISDLVVVFGWAGQDANALTTAREVGVSGLETYAVRSVAKSGRNIGEYRWAIDGYRFLLKSNPADCDALLGLAYSYTDARESANAEARLNQFDAECVADITEPRLIGQRANESVAARTYWAQRQNTDGKSSDLSALSWWSAALKQVTQKKDNKPLADANHLARSAQFREGVLLASAAGAYHLVNEWFPHAAAAMSENERASVLAAMAAQKIRWAANAPNGERMGWRTLLNDALSELDAASLLASDPVLKRTIVADTIIALAEFGDVEKILLTVNEADQSKMLLPPYAEVAVADALMRVNQPRRAAQRLQNVVAQQRAAGENVNRDVAITLFYALIDQGKFSAARDWIEISAKAIGPFAFRGLPGVEMEDDDYVRFQLARALLISPAKGSREFQRSYDELGRILNNGPFNVSVRLDQADWQSARGWPRAANESVALVLTDDPTNLRALEFRARLALDTGNMAQYRDAYDELNRLDAHPLVLRRVREAYDREMGYALSMGATHGRSSDAIADTGLADLEADVSLISAPLLQFLRMKARWRTNEATFGSRNQHADFFALGVRLYQPYWWTDIEATQRNRAENGSNAPPGLRLKASWQMADAFTSSMVAALRSEDLPLRGQAEGTTARSLQLSLSWRALAQTYLGLSGARLLSTDNNARNETSAYVDHAESLSDQLIGTMRLDWDRSTNRLNNVAYFSPLRQESVGITTGLLHTLMRAGQHSWTHKLTLGLGRLAQEGFGVARTQSASYEQEWRFDAAKSIALSLGQSRRPYDGVESRRTTFSIRLNLGL